MFELLSEYRNEAQYVILIAVAAAALHWGGGPERATAAGLLYLLLADWIYRALFGRGTLSDVDVGYAFIDLSAAIIFIATGLFANRIYTLWVGALQIIAAMAHLARMLQDAVSPLAYAIMSIAPSYLQILLLAVGLLAHMRRKRRFGEYRSWRISSPTRSAIVAMMSRRG